MTGVPVFFDGASGLLWLQRLAQRLLVDSTSDARFDTPRAVQFPLAIFDIVRLQKVGRRVRDVFASGAADPEWIRAFVDDRYVATLAKAVTGRLGGKVGVTPRIFVKRLLGDVLDRVDQLSDFDPRRRALLLQ